MLLVNISIVELENQQELEDQLEELKKGQALIAIMDQTDSGDMQLFLRDNNDQIASADITDETTIEEIMVELDNMENGW